MELDEDGEPTFGVGSPVVSDNESDGIPDLTSDTESEYSCDEDLDTTVEGQAELPVDSDEEEEEVPAEYRDIDSWTASTTNPPNFPREVNLEHEPGLQPGVWKTRQFHHPTETGHPSEFYSLLWPCEWDNEIAARSNSYANMLIQTGKVTWKHFTPTTGVEIRALHGVLMFMSMKKHQGGLKSYWREYPFGDPWVKSVFSKRRFMFLMRIFHVVDDWLATDEAKKDRTIKVKAWYIRVTEQILRIWFPGKIICIDETMTLGTAAPIRQEMDAKPIKCGPKSYTAVDQYGVVLFTFIYPGNKTGDPEIGHATAVVKAVMDALRTKGHTIVTDNFYGSFESLKVIREAGNNCILMLRKPKAVKKDSPAMKTNPCHALSLLVNKSSPRGARVQAFLQNQCMLTLWRDNAVVAILTDAIGCEKSEGLTERRRKKGCKKAIEVRGCEVIKKYNKWKSLVDRYNQKKAEGDVYTTFRRWWKRCFINGPWLQSECSSWRIFQRYSTTPNATSLSFLALREQLVMWMVEGYVASKVRLLIQPTMQHTLAKLPSEIRRQCAVCRTGGSTVTFCTGCNMMMHRKCFIDHHNHLLK